jgi:hypothetical protein
MCKTAGKYLSCWEGLTVMDYSCICQDNHPLLTQSKGVNCVFRNERGLDY